MGSNPYEEMTALKESARNACMDSYFDARPFLERTKQNRKIFEDGFDRAWEWMTHSKEVLK